MMMKIGTIGTQSRRCQDVHGDNGGGGWRGGRRDQFSALPGYVTSLTRFGISPYRHPP
jgi:hypothetical protein